MYSRLLRKLARLGKIKGVQCSHHLLEITHEVGRNQSQPSAQIQHVGFHKEHPKEHAFSLFDNLYDKLGAIGRVG